MHGSICEVLIRSGHLVPYFKDWPAEVSLLKPFGTFITHISHNSYT